MSTIPPAVIWIASLIILYVIGSIIVIQYEKREKLTLKARALDQRAMRLSEQEEADRRKLEEERSKLQKEFDNYKAIVNKTAVKIEERAKALDALATEKGKGYPTLTKAYKEWCEYQDLQLVRYLGNKSRPAPKAQEAVKQSTARARLAEAKVKQLEYLLEEYRFLYPDLEDVTSEDIQDAIAAEEPQLEDPVKKWLPLEDFLALPPGVRNQKALEKYLRRPRSKWEVGRDYERYIGYKYEIEGWDVDYFGAKKGKSDLGRDLIVHKGADTLIIQCKYWKSGRVMRERDVFQLMGSVFDYAEKHKREHNELISTRRVRGVLFTTATISNTARIAADLLAEYISIQEGIELNDDYPRIKCNVGTAGSKIYHLPMDQLYDRVKIRNKLECYVRTVSEAEALGFQRAKKWKPDFNST